MEIKVRIVVTWGMARKEPAGCGNDLYLDLAGSYTSI